MIKYMFYNLYHITYLFVFVLIIIKWWKEIVYNQYHMSFVIFLFWLLWHDEKHDLWLYHITL